MSQSFEKETTASTAKSLLGALIALGSGFCFMFVGLVAVTASSTTVQGDRSTRLLTQALQSDVLTYERGSLQISKDQKTVRIRLLGVVRDQREVTYSVVGESGELSRSAAGSNIKLGRFKNARFDSSAGLLQVRWLAADGQRRKSWALERWSGKGESS